MRLLPHGPLARALRNQSTSYTQTVKTLATVISFQHAKTAPCFRQRRLAHAIPTATQALIPLHRKNQSYDPFEDQNTVLAPPTSEQRNPAAWAKLTEPYLPIHLRNPVGDGHESITTTEYRLTNLTRIILAAKTAVNIDILSYLGLEEGRWEAVLWMIQVLIDTSPSPQSRSSNAKPLSNINWPSSKTLDDITLEPFLLDYRAMDELGPQQPLTSFTTSRESIWKTASSSRGKMALGQIWQTLGNLILEADARGGEGSDEIMSYVLRIIADLHHKGWIPENVYRYHVNDDPSSVHQPPLLHALSSRILSALSDAVYQTHVEAMRSAAERQAIALAASSHRTSSHGLGPEVWMEFILWCCVHGSWLMEGSSITEVIRRQSPKSGWSLLRWSTDEGFSGFERKISTEVIIALVDGLVLSLTRSRDLPKEYTAAQVIERISWLKLLLEKNRTSLGVLNWDAIIARFSESPDFEIESNPRLMQAALELAEIYGRSLTAVNTPHDNNHVNPQATYVFDPSAAVLGLYHRTMHAYIKTRDIDGALSLLSRLLLLTEKNQSLSLKEFFAELTAASEPRLSAEMTLRAESKTLAFKTLSFRNVESITNLFPGVQFPGFHPDIPIRILADLLDLITEAGLKEIGQWMIHSRDPDGPLVSEDMYGNQIIAPALIRFAAITSDKGLLSKLMRAQTAVVSARTLVALCESRVEEGSWQGAADVLGLIRDHFLYTWDARDFATLLRPLIVHNLQGTNRQSRETQSPPASQLLQRLLRGDLGQVWGPRFARLDSIVGVLSSISPLMARICSGTLIGGRQYTLNMHRSVFDLLLQGALDALGSTAGIALWEKWCNEPDSVKVVEVPKVSASDATTRRTFAFQGFFGEEPPMKNSVPGDEEPAVFTGCVPRTIKTLRLIIQHALQEHRKSTPPNSEIDAAKDDKKQGAHGEAPKHDVLEWAAGVLRSDFDFSPADINYELEGYLTNHPQPLTQPPRERYSPQTLSIYRAFTGSRKQWVLAREDQLRKFVGNPEEKQVIFEYVPPAQRYFLHCLAADLGLVSESFGEAMDRAVKVSKTPIVRELPTRRVEEVVRRSSGGY